MTALDRRLALAALAFRALAFLPLARIALFLTPLLLCEAHALALGLGPLRPLSLGPQPLLALLLQLGLAPQALVIGAGALASLGALALQSLAALSLQLLRPLALEPRRVLPLPPLGRLALLALVLIGGLSPLSLAPLRLLAALSLELLGARPPLALGLLLALALALRAAIVVVPGAGVEGGGADLHREVVVARPAAEIARLEAGVEGRGMLGALGLGRIALTVVVLGLGERLGDAAPLVGRG